MLNNLGFYDNTLFLKLQETFRKEPEPIRIKGAPGSLSNMKEKSVEDNLRECRQNIRQEIKHWKDINQNGCSDPFWPDGCNMNLTRNHIIYYQRQLEETCAKNQISLPDEYYLAVPPEVDANYMANLRQKPRVERLRQTGRITTGRFYQYDENQMSLF